MAQHARLKLDAVVQACFCDPQNPWQRGANENTNALLRQYFPKSRSECAQRRGDRRGGGHPQRPPGKEVGKKVPQRP